jgi:hypothetical protein
MNKTIAVSSRQISALNFDSISPEFRHLGFLKVTSVYNNKGYFSFAQKGYKQRLLLRKQIPTLFNLRFCQIKDK